MFVENVIDISGAKKVTYISALFLAELLTRIASTVSPYEALSEIKVDY
jgi:hypothetical protein